MIPPLPDRIKDAVAAAEKTKTVKEIAEACDVSVQTVYDWRKGKTINLKGETVVELAEVSGFNARWIINGKGRKLGVSADERLVIDAFPLLSEDMRESWIDAARKALARAQAATNSA